MLCQIVLEVLCCYHVTTLPVFQLVTVTWWRADEGHIALADGRV